MLKSDFYYHLPEELIAQEPIEPRDAAKLLVMNRETGELEDRIFNQLPELLKKGDLLVANNSKVLPARLIGERENKGVCEVLLLRQIKENLWECLAKPGKKMRLGDKAYFGDGSLIAEIKETLPSGGKIISFSHDAPTIYQKLDEFGQMPIPPYISKQLADNDSYQTVYAKELGSAAAPTAGLHFTPELIRKLDEKGINFTEVTLHVGLGTFRPVQEETVENHLMHSEWFSLDENTAKMIRETKKNGGRVIAVGTTSCRTLESVAKKYGEICAASGDTNIFIYPGYEFQAIDGLITNFHLPESTLIMLVSAFCGYDNTMNAYQEAVKRKYRFFSFGDAMLLI